MISLATPLPEAPRADQVYELTSGEESVVLAIRRLLGLRLSETILPVDVRLYDWRGTNALLTRRGARTAFVTTRGFADVLRIGYQNRPRLFDLRRQAGAALRGGRRGRRAHNARRHGAEAR